MSKYNFELDIKNKNVLSVIISWVKPNSKVLEFGPAHGRMTKHLKEVLNCVVDIVEIDSDAGNEAAYYANRALIGSEKGNIEKYFWLEEFQQTQYDYIVFADVLEHLYEPEEVLLQCNKLLKGQGNILISTPNIAHNSIIENLYNDNFNYTQTGLLDNTHIRFWGLNNLKALCDTTGYIIKKMDATTCELDDNEQSNLSHQKDEELRRLLGKRPFGNAYQFILKLKKQSQERQCHDSLTTTNVFPMSVYLDCGDGYSEDYKFLFFLSFNKTYKHRIDLVEYKNIRNIRIDPIEGISCKIKHLHVQSNLGIEKFVPQNCAYLENGEDWFESVDPKYEREELAGDIEWIEFEVLLEPLTFLELIEIKTKAEKQSKQEIIKMQLSLQQTQGELQQTQGELQQTQGELQQTQGELQQTQGALQEVERAYECISKSEFWRITKPLRVMIDIIKSVKKIGLKNHNNKSVDESRPFNNEDDLEYQKNIIFKRAVKFSILVPLYNTPEKFLCEMIESVQSQTYADWELCLADGSDTRQKWVEAIVKKYMVKDTRIRYRNLKENKGISGNTNECIKMATGQYMVLLDHDDILHPAALFECMRAITEQNADFIYTDENTFAKTIDDAYCPHFKPDYAPDTLRSYNYICHLSVFSSELLREAGQFTSKFDGSQDYDMVLRLTEKAKNIIHIPKILYYWRAHQGSVAADVSEKPYTIIAAKKALKEHLDRIGLEGTVKDSKILSTYKIDYKIIEEPLVSIIIPNKDHCDDLKKCINSIFHLSTYKNFEIIIIENNSEEASTFEYYKSLKQYINIKIVNWEGGFNYSAINNYGARFAKGEYILLLNNDIEIITPTWMEEMLMFAQRNDVGAVGAMLYYPDDTVQHAGVILGIGGIAGHSHKYFKRNSYGYMSRMTIAQNLSCVTGACLMVSQSVFKQVGGLDESLEIAFNDVDLCMKIRQAGYLIIWTPYSELYHYESKSRGLEDTAEKKARFYKETELFNKKWNKEIKKGDPYYNPNLTLDKEDFSYM